MSAAGGGHLGSTSSWTQELLGSFLSLNDIPATYQVSAACKHARNIADSFRQAGAEVEPHGDAMIAVLHMLLPGTALPTASMLASLV